VLIKPLPYPTAGELVSIKHVAPGLNVSELRMSATQYFTYKDEGRVFQHIGLYGDGGATINGVGDPEQARALLGRSSAGAAPGRRARPSEGIRAWQAPSPTGTDGVERDITRPSNTSSKILVFSGTAVCLAVTSVDYKKMTRQPNGLFRRMLLLGWNAEVYFACF
jgi:hypothetical protein